MKTLEDIKNYKSKCLDGRDEQRLLCFLTIEEVEAKGYEFKEGLRDKHETIPLTRENVLKKLENDLEFAFDKALNGRGISSALMHTVIQMWNWILQEGLAGDDEYENYGLPLFKKTALKYGFPNPIGEDEGSERKYSTEGVYGK